MSPPNDDDVEDGMTTGSMSGTAARSSRTSVSRLTADFEGLPPSRTPTVSSNAGCAAGASVLLVVSETSAVVVSRSAALSSSRNSAGELTYSQPVARVCE